MGVFIEHFGVPELPPAIGPFELSLIANRGQRIYPGDAPDIAIVNCHCCRYLSDAPVSEADALNLIRQLDEQGVRWVHIEKLHHDPAGQPQYSRAQGD